MKKSKSWLKSLLIVVLAMLMVVSLVACNNKKKEEPKPEPTPVGTESVQDCFNGLWEAAKPIGTTAIPKDADLSIELGMEIALNTVNETSTQVYQTIDFGVNIQAVIGRKDSTKNNTALKLKLYDPTDANNEEILTIYVFARDIENLYLDYAGKNVKVPHDMAKLIWNEAFEEKGDLIDLLPKALSDKFIELKKGADKESINDIINSFTGDFGANWSLNSIIDRVISMLGVDLKGLLEGLANDEQTGGMINTFLPVLELNSIDDLFDSNGKLDLLKLLTGKVGEILFIANKTTNGNVTTHRASLSTTITGLFSLLKSTIGFDLGSLLGGTTGDIALQYTETNGVLNDFGILARLGGVSISLSDGTICYPELSVKINKFKIREANESNKVTTKVSQDQYKETIAFNEKLVLEMHGVDLKQVEGMDMPEDGYSFNGVVEIDVRGMIDIVDTTATNKTKANLTVTLKGDDEEPVVLAQASFMNGKVVCELDKAIDYEDEKTGETKQIKGFVYDLGEDFNVAKLVRESVIKSLRENFPPKEEDPTEGPKEDEGSEGSTAAEEGKKFDLDDFIKKVTAGIKQAFKLISTNNNLEITTNNILETVVVFKEAMYPAQKKADRWDVNNRTEYIVNLLLNPPHKDKNIADCMTLLEDEMDKIKAEMDRINSEKKEEEGNNEVVPGEEQGGQSSALNEGETPETPVTPGEEETEFDWKGTYKTVQDLALRVLYLCAQQVRIKGVATSDFKASDYAKFEIIDKDGNKVKFGDDAWTDENTIYINNIIAVLGAQITIKGDLQKGIHASIEVAFAEATMSATQSFELIDVTEDTFTDLYTTVYEKATETEKEQWMVITAEKKDEGGQQGGQEGGQEGGQA